jgi:heptosyltransferase-2
MSEIQNSKFKIKNLNKILIVRTDRVGDVLLSTPAIKAVRDAYPKSHIAFMVSPYARDVVEGNPYLDEVIVYDKLGSDRGIFGMLRFASKLIKKRFDLAIVLHPTQRAHMAVWLAGIPSRVGYDTKFGWMLTKRLPHTKHYGLKHEIDNVLDLLKYVGIEAKDRSLCMPVQARCERKVKELFASAGIADKDTVITINPGASCPSKRWPADRFASVAAALAAKWNAKIVLISDDKDKVFADKAAAGLKSPCLNLAGMTTVCDLAAVLNRSKLFISNDSGPVHIACAVGTPVISIFGRSDRGLSPRRWGPSGQRDMVLHKDTGCGVCLAHNCRVGFKCLDAVSVDEVVASADRLLASGRT